jgi:hypothetical protein
MPYRVSDASRKSAAGPTISGLKDIKKLIAAHKTSLLTPAFDQFLLLGYTNMLQELIAECETLSKHTRDKNIKWSLSEFAAFARIADEIVVLEL